MVEKTAGEKLAEEFIFKGKDKRKVAEALAQEKLYDALSKKSKELKAKEKEIKEFKRNEKKENRGRQILKDVRYKRSVSGQLSKALTYFQKKREQQAKFNSRFRSQRPMRPTISPMQQLQIARQQATQNYYDYAFSNFRNPQANVAQHVEAEVMNNATGGFANDGNAQAFVVDRLALGNSKILNDPSLNILQNIDDQVLFGAMITHRNPVRFQVAQVDFFANILTPKGKRGK